MHLEMPNVCPRQTRDRICAETTCNGLSRICTSIDEEIILSSGRSFGLSSKDLQLDWQYLWLVKDRVVYFPIYCSCCSAPKTEKPFDGLSWLQSFLSHRCRSRRVKMVCFVCCLFADTTPSAGGPPKKCGKTTHSCDCVGISLRANTLAQSTALYRWLCAILCFDIFTVRLFTALAADWLQTNCCETVLS